MMNDERNGARRGEARGRAVTPRLAANRSSVADLVIAAIRDMVVQGTVREGDKLPNQNDLAKLLGVSKPSLREALNHMSRLGVIEQRPGRGIILLCDDPELWVDRPRTPEPWDRTSVRELIEARRIIESELVVLAVERMSASDVEELEATVRRMRTALAGLEIRRYLQEDLSFHRQIARGSGNRYMINMYLTMRGLMGKFIAGAFHDHPELVRSSLDHHEAILAAFLARDSEAARRAMEAHIADIRITLEM